MRHRDRWIWSRRLDEGRALLPAHDPREEGHRRHLLRLHERLLAEAEDARLAVPPEASRRLAARVTARLQDAPRRARPPRARLVLALALPAAAALALALWIARPDETGPAPARPGTAPPAPALAGSPDPARLLPWWLPTGLVLRLGPDALLEPLAEAPDAEDGTVRAPEPEFRPLEGILVAEARQLAVDSQRAAEAFLSRLPLPTVERFRPH